MFNHVKLNPYLKNTLMLGFGIVLTSVQPYKNDCEYSSSIFINSFEMFQIHNIIPLRYINKVEIRKIVFLFQLESPFLLIQFFQLFCMHSQLVSFYIPLIMYLGCVLLRNVGNYLKARDCNVTKY